MSACFQIALSSPSWDTSFLRQRKLASFGPAYWWSSCQDTWQDTRFCWACKRKNGVGAIFLLKGTTKNLLRGHLLHLRALPCASIAASLGAISVPLATVFRSPLKCCCTEMIGVGFPIFVSHLTLRCLPGGVTLLGCHLAP